MDVVLLGARGHAKDTIKNIEEHNANEVRATKRFNILGCLDDVKKPKKGASLLGYQILNSMEILSRKPFGGIRVICAVGDPFVKKALVVKARAHRLKFFSFVHPSVRIHRTTVMGDGVNIFSNSLISADCRIGDHVSINYACSVNHDCRISEYATLSPGARLGGKCSIGAYSLVGINACTVHGITMGDWSVLGAGSTAIRDIPGTKVAAGNPARPIGRRDKNRPIL
jgi:sugar O-acyltransferase (sialic acid O-acetyltransferase NeuD family)